MTLLPILHSALSDRIGTKCCGYFEFGVIQAAAGANVKLEVHYYPNFPRSRRRCGMAERRRGGNANQTGVETVETRNGRNAAFNSAADRGSRVRPCPSVRQSPPLKSVGSWKRRGGGGGMR